MPMAYDGGATTDEPLTIRLLQLRAPIPLISLPIPGTRATPGVATPRVITEIVRYQIPISNGGVRSKFLWEEQPLHVHSQAFSHVFAHRTIIARNPHQELYEYLRDKVDGFITFADPDAPPNVDQVRHTPISSNKPELIIIDDYSNDKLLQKNLFSHYYTRGRHFKLSTIFLSHSYFATDKMIRLNSKYVAILKANSKRDLQMVVKDFNIKGVDERSIVYYYNKATERKGQMLFIDSVKGQIRYNFDMPIRIED
ncbi:unnamed protein product [Phytophthora fragariaefolia]|uniref:Unnamed protein product n=1 Tax=Phytophthora fragariaefolia TaxID=1490495 RepID=A0A9W6U7G8_9STRA|nr:unnamed protein product [Phytophthora fragariaefolia]